jgi:hypothetical protein
MSLSGVTATAFAATVAGGRDKWNPFQVYPVRGLSEIENVAAVTVPTPEVLQVEAAVKEYAAAIGVTAEPYPKLLLAAKGDFGTGKTHLMLYASSVLASEIKARREHATGPAADIGDPIAVLAVSSEAPIEDWYASELGPLLIEISKPRELVRDLLARLAETVALEDPDPDVRALAPQFRSSRRALYQAFREPGSFDISAVDEQFSAAIARACPRTSRSFRRAIDALRWEETSELAEDWLAGNELSAADMVRIGVRLEGERAVRAANAICAIAFLARELGRPFALFLDEFEHLTRHDKCTGSKRNITWTKRLVESLARRGAMVFISGHWEAWEQQGDFLDRFVGGRPIQLVRLSDKDVTDVIRVRAGVGAWPGFTPDAARWVVEATSGNIRRVITVLYDLWGDPAAPKAEVTEAAIRLAAQRRLQPGSEIGIVPAIEAAIRAKGGVVKRNERFGEDVPVDITAYLGTELRLAVAVVHARDELALIGSGQRFAELVKRRRSDHRHLRGLVVMLGAVLERQVSTLDAAFPETDMVSGEEPGVVERLPDIVARALGPPAQPESAPTREAQAALEAEQIQVVGRAIGQNVRSQEVLGSDSRSDAVRQTLAPDSQELARQEATARLRVFDGIMNDLNVGVRAQFLSGLLRRPLSILFLMAGLVTAFGSATIKDYIFGFAGGITGPDHLASQPYYPLVQLVQLGLVTLAVVFIVTGLGYAAKLYLDLLEFRDYRKQEMKAHFEADAPIDYMLRRNKEMGDMLSAYGPRQARLNLIEDRIKIRAA